jgi:energy-coupling factor transport system permease protein
MAVLKDITLGKYIAVDSPLHCLDPRTKFIATLALMSAVLTTSKFVALIPFALFLACALFLARLPVGIVLNNLRPFVWLFSITFVLNALLTPGTILWLLPVLDYAVTAEGLQRGGLLCLRLSATIITAALLTLTTAPTELTSGLERLLKPLRRIGLPAHELAMMVSISLRFVPVLVEEAERLHKAQLARGADFSGGPIRRIQSLIPLLVPLFISSFARADRLALAMESRCYRGGDQRTHFRPLHFQGIDLAAALIVLFTLLLVLWVAKFYP